MQLSGIFLGLGEETFGQLLRSVSISGLKTYQLYERMKVRLHLPKLNASTLRAAEPKLWQRLKAGEEDLATELAQAILVGHLEMIISVLNFLGIPHEDGFFAKDLDGAKYLTGDWQQRVFDKFQASYPPALLLFYVNHLGWEVAKMESVFRPAISETKA
jgi:hypothetical protein